MLEYLKGDRIYRKIWLVFNVVFVLLLDCILNGNKSMRRI